MVNLGISKHRYAYILLMRIIVVVKEMVYDMESDGVELAERIKEIKKCEHEWKIRERKTFNAAAEKVTEIKNICVKCGTWIEDTRKDW